MLFLLRWMVIVFLFWNKASGAAPPHHAFRMNMRDMMFKDPFPNFMPPMFENNEMAFQQAFFENNFMPPMFQQKKPHHHNRAHPEAAKQPAPHKMKVHVAKAEPAQPAPPEVDPQAAHKSKHEDAIHPQAHLPVCVDSDYTPVRFLGRGVDGVVTLYQRTQDGKRFAKKEAVPNSMARRNLIQEIKILTQLKNKGVTADIECVAKDSRSFMMEYISGVNLDKIDVTTYPNISPETKVKFLAKRMVEIYITLHQLNIVHGDGHFRNWLFDPLTGGLYLVDFGRSVDFKAVNEASYDCYPNCKNRDIETAGKLWASIYYNYVNKINDEQARTWISVNENKVFASLSNNLKNVISLMWPKAKVDFNQLKPLVSQLD